MNFADIPIRVNDVDVDAGWWNILRLAGVTMQENLLVSIESNSQSGSDITLTNPTKPIVALTNAALLSIATIAAPAVNSQIFILINRTGGTYVLKKTSTIDTGTSSDLDIANGKTLQLVYDTVGAIWRVVGGTGSGGGGFSNIVTRTASGTIDASEDCTIIDATSGSIILTLPAVTLKEQHNFKRIDAVEANTVTIQRAGSDTIDGQPNYTIPYQNGVLKIVGYAAGKWGIF